MHCSTLSRGRLRHCPHQRATASRNHHRAYFNDLKPRTICCSVDREQEARYQALLSELRSLQVGELRTAVSKRPELTSSTFLFWLSDHERKLQGSDKEEVQRVGGELVYLKEWMEYQTNKTLIPSLASSLAYSNYQEWRTENPGASAPEIAPGVDVEQLYKLSEKEERKLRDSPSAYFVGQATSAPAGPRGRSSVDEFAKSNQAYMDLAAGAMARARARLMGYQDDEQGAAVQALDVLLQYMYSREERATFLPEAFIPPGLSLPGGRGSVVTTPQALLQAARSSLKQLHSRGQQASSEGDAASDTGASSSSSSSAPVQASSIQGSSIGGASVSSALPDVLTSGESTVQVLKELIEDVEEYEAHVYKGKSQLERFGAQGPW
mmetsp:Transcript_26006/g.56707  ORF Transcript_26006/g.56707 Transcript_26006/m.56707 type:complete len:380 (+) Transcript_26006:79-1218(+)